MAVIAAVGSLLALAALLPHRSSAASPSLSQLQSELATQQARQQALGHSIGGLSQQAADLRNQIALVQSREAAMRADLARDQAALAEAEASLGRARARLHRVERLLAWARYLLSQQLLSAYERGQPSLVSVVLESNGFADLLDRFTYLHDAENQQQRVIALTRAAKALATEQANRLSRLEANDRLLANGAAVRVRALAGMNLLLGTKQSALARALAGQESELASSRAKGGALQSQIAQIQAQQAAAAAAALAASRAAAAAAAAPQGGSAPTFAAAAPSGGWAIPYAIVLCESGGQNLPPNSAGASGYYQILPATWKLYGGSGPAAYLASKGEQDAVASRIWNGGAGASSWVCAGI
ncbi:MAG TPA: transglycosylase family protein, partial [Longimicrobiales bacterium]